MPAENIVQIITRLPRETRREFKAACASRGVTMTAALLAAVAREIDRFKKVQK